MSNLDTTAVHATLSERSGAATATFGAVSFTLSPQAYQLLSDLSTESGDSSEDLMRKALGLMKIAVEARRTGGRLGVIGRGGKPEFEIDIS